MGKCEHARFSDLSSGDKATAGAVCLAASLVVMVVTALAVDYCHRRRGRGRGHDAEAVRGSDEVQQSPTRLAASQARTQELELELAAAHEQTRARNAQIAELDQRFRGVCEELVREQLKTRVLERRLSLAEEARDLEEKAQQTTYEMYRESRRQVEELQGLLGVQVEHQLEDDEEPEVHAPPASPALPAAEAQESETEYFSAA